MRYVFLLIVVICITGCLSNKETSATEGARSVEPALLQMLEIPWLFYTSKSRNPPYREQLEAYLTHTDDRVRRAAIDLLAIHRTPLPRTPGEHPQWQNENAPLRELKDRPTATEDVLFDIIQIRTHVPRQPKEMLARNAQHFGVLKRLVHYLRHPNRNVRRASYKTLIGIQGDCPIHSAEVWEKWLADLEEWLISDHKKTP